MSEALLSVQDLSIDFVGSGTPVRVVDGGAHRLELILAG